MKKLFAAVLGALVLLTAPGVAQERETATPKYQEGKFCTSDLNRMEDIYRKEMSLYGKFVGLISESMLVKIYTNQDTGDFMIVTITPDGVGCLRMSGSDWTIAEQPLNKKDTH